MGKPTTEKDQYYHAFEVKIARIWNWNMRYLLKIHGYTRGIYIYYIPQRTKTSQFSVSKVNPIQLENLICMFHLNNQLLTRSNKLFQKKHTSKCV